MAKVTDLWVTDTGPKVCSRNKAFDFPAVWLDTQESLVFRSKEVSVNIKSRMRAAVVPSSESSTVPHMPGFVLTFLWPVSICVLNLEALLVRKLWVYYHWNAELHFVNTLEPAGTMGKDRFCFWWAGSFTNLNPEAELKSFSWMIKCRLALQRSQIHCLSPTWSNSTTCNSSSEGSSALFWPPRYKHSCVQTPTQTHTWQWIFGAI